MNFKLFFESWIENAKAYYITDDGIFHPVKTTHIDQILEDFDLISEFESLFKDNFGEPIDYSNDYDNEVIKEYTQDFCQEQGISFLVYDLANKTLHIRNKESNLNKKQKQSVFKFCYAKRAEINYDSISVA